MRVQRHPLRVLLCTVALTTSSITAPNLVADQADERGKPAAAGEVIQSGRNVGAYVPTFYSRVVTGPLMNKSVCFVCRNGERPVVMVFMRSLTPEMKPLLKNIERLVDQNRKLGLRSFGVLLSDEPVTAAPKLQTFAFNSKLAMPLTVATDAVAGPSCQDVHPDAAVTVVLYRKRRVVSTFAFREAELELETVRDVINGVRGFAAEGR